MRRGFRGAKGDDQGPENQAATKHSTWEAPPGNGLIEMEHARKNPRVVQLEMALLNATSALGDLIAAIRTGKSIDRESDPSLPSTMGTYLEVAESKHQEALDVLRNASLPP
jgi:hypothetical protein